MDSEQQRNEILFWKVFHNKLIRNNIMHQIETNELDGKRIKFKNITSLNSLVVNKQYQLLNCKLKAGEYIEISYISISTLIGQMVYNSDENLNENDNNDLRVNSLNSRQSFNLLLIHKPKELLQFDLLYSLIEHGDYWSKSSLVFMEEIDNILQYNVNSNKIIDQYSIEYIISYLPAPILDKIVNHLKKINYFKDEPLIHQKIKNYSFTWAKNSYYKEEVIEYILNDDQLFNYPSNTKDCKVEKMNIETLFKIKSPSIQIRLLQLNYFNYEFYTLEFKIRLLNIFNTQHDWESKVKEIYKLFSEINSGVYIDYQFKYDNPMNLLELLFHSMEGKDRDELTYLPLEEIDVWRKILQMGYYNSINGKVESNFIKLYTLGYEYFKCNEYDKYIIDYIDSVNKSNNHKEYEKLLGSIIKTNENQIFTNLLCWDWFNLFDIKSIENEKRFVIHNNDTFKEIKSHMDQFQLLQKLYTTSVSLNKFKFVYENWFIVPHPEWLSKFSDGSVNYADLYSYPFTSAINNCNLESLKEMDQKLGFNRIKFCEFETTKSIGLINYSNQDLLKIKKAKKLKKFGIVGYWDKVKINFNNISINEPNNKIVDLIEYLNSSGFKLFSSELFKKFIKDISKLSFSNELKVNFEQFQSESLELVLDSITNNVNPNLLKFILNNNISLSIPNIDIFGNNYRFRMENSNEFDILLDTSYFGKRTLNGKESYYCFTQSTLFYSIDNSVNDIHMCHLYQSSFDIISCIDLILGHFENNYQQISTIDDGSFNVTQKLVNYLFKRLIKIYYVDINRVKRIYKSIKSIWLSITGVEFEFQHTFYHIVYYISIRSLKFTEYISSSVINQHIASTDEGVFDNINFNYEDPLYFEDQQTDEFDASSSGLESPQFKFFKSFSFDYIFNTPLDQLIDKLNEINLNIKEMDNK